MPALPHWTAGNVVEIELGGAWAYGQVVGSPLMGFYAARSTRIADVGLLANEDFAFKIWVMKYAIGKRGWPLVGHFDLSEAKKVEPWFFKKDLVSGRLTKYRDSTQEEIPASAVECRSLECAAAWDPKHIESRLADNLAGRPNVWVESLRAK
jgi:hypothetical protein